MTPKEIRFPVQRLRNPIPRPLIWIGTPLAILLCFALFFHPASLGNVVRDFSSTEKVHIVNYYTVATSHLPPQKEGELSFSYTDTEKQEAFLEILDRYVLFKSPNQTYGGIGEEVYRLAIDLTDAHEPSGILAITVHSTGDFTMNGTQYDVGFGRMHGQQLYQDLAAFLEEFA